MTRDSQARRLPTWIVLASLSLAIALPLSGQAAEGVTGAELSRFFDIEGNAPFLPDGALRFSALESRFLTASGHGWRNELKKKAALRRSLYATEESLSARILTRLSRGSRTIIVQYHDSGTGTLAKVYVADAYGPGLPNGIARDGVFDIFARITGADLIERTFPLGTTSYGGLFDLSVRNARGMITIRVGAAEIAYMAADADAVYLKFGNYLQAQDPYSGERADRERFAEFYAANGMVEDTVEFLDATYSSK